MESLAVELLERIFFFACTDGGYTGCSLSLVSKNIRDASRAARFYSVSLMESSVCQLTEFNTCFRAERARALAQGTTLRVRHLCISACKSEQTRFRPKREEQAPLSIGRGITGMSSSPCWMNAVMGRMDVGPDQQQAFDDAVSALLTAVAPDLRTLAVCHGWATFAKHFRMPSLDGVPVEFPALEELTLAGMEWNFRTNHGMFGAPAAAALPRLERLHITDVGATGRYIDLGVWSARAPRLTHLRLTNMGPYTDVWPQVKRVVAPDSDGTSAELLFPNLEQLVLQPNVIGGKSTESYTDRIQDLGLLATRPLVILPLREHVNQTDERTATKALWMDRIAGGPGCWEAVDNLSKPPLPESAA
ncbi:hypothetical protein GSI_01217 [Ganoderma sinense ZZ0214-1]|uniref:F-box domain-containing protein n=1 Tax=Ganoderma sinense ZZ0214-1 TaxID=1077348 RepID=A0A2G8SUX4_9APHY|nr:hypothetical protein GSI_01217 [Ganoderma sinense ZZ0214-1]